MPLDTETIVLVEERDRILEAREELAAKVAGIEAGNPAHDGLVAEGKRLDNRLQGVEWAIAEWDVDTVTLAAPTGGEWGRMEDRLAEARDGADITPGQGASRVYTVAQGTVEAPYVADAETFEATLSATAQLPVPYLKWAQAKINDLMSVGNGERRSFDALVAAKRRETSTED
jgi:hypothetical protein